MEDLTTHFGGNLTAPTPFVVGSGPPAVALARILAYLMLNWVVITKTFSRLVPITNVSPAYHYWGHDGEELGPNLIGQDPDRIDGMANAESISHKPYFPFWDGLLKAVFERMPNARIIASMMEPHNKDAWEESIGLVAPYVAGIEGNLGCPQDVMQRGMGATVGAVPELVYESTCWAVKALGPDKPVYVKIGPNTGPYNIGALVEAVMSAGGHISLLNTAEGVAGVDWDTVPPTVFPDVKGYSTPCGLSGSEFFRRQVAAFVRRAALIRDERFPNSKIMGVGGVRRGKHAADLLGEGADGIQLCTALMNRANPEQLIAPLSDELSSVLVRQGKTLPELRGMLLPRMKPYSELVVLSGRTRADLVETTEE